MTWRESPMVRGSIDIAIVLAAVVDAFDPRTDPVTTGLALLGAVVVLVRRRWPIAVFLLTLPGLIGGSELIASLVALFTISEHARRKSVVFGSTAVIFVIVFVKRPEDPDGRLLFSLVYAVLFAVGPVVLGRLVAIRVALHDKISQLHAAREREVQREAELLHSHARARLASEMHDVVAHQVSLIAVRAGALEMSATNDRERAAGEEIRGLAVTTLTELRSMVALLRASDGAEGDLVAHLQFRDLPELIRRSGLPVESHLTFPDNASPRVQHAVYRCVQESLTNARKHAPGASIVVTVEPQSEHVVVTVDVGAPQLVKLELPGTGSGLIGLRERAESLGGTFDAHLRPDGSQITRMQLPLGD